MNKENQKELERQIFEETMRCTKCRMCIPVCPTYEGWFTQGAYGRLLAINHHLKYGLGDAEALSRLLFACTTCRRCQERCRVVATGINPTDTIIKARQFLLKREQAKEGKD